MKFDPTDIRKKTVKKANKICELIEGERPKLGCLWDGDTPAVLFFRLPRTNKEWVEGFATEFRDFLAVISGLAKKQKQASLEELTNLLTTIVQMALDYGSKK